MARIAAQTVSVIFRLATAFLTTCIKSTSAWGIFCTTYKSVCPKVHKMQRPTQFHRGPPASVPGNSQPGTVDGGPPKGRCNSMFRTKERVAPLRGEIVCKSLDSFKKIRAHTHTHRWPSGKIDGPGKWNNTHPNQCHLFLTT